MNYIDLINEIILKLKNADKLKDAERVTNALSNSFVSSELLFSVTHELLEILRENNDLFDLIGSDVKKLKDYCWSIGIEVK